MIDFTCVIDTEMGNDKSNDEAEEVIVFDMKKIE
jgi:hypothetical protein